MISIHPMLLALKVEEEGISQKCKQPPGDGKGKDTNSPLELQKELKPDDTFIFADWNFWPPVG